MHSVNPALFPLRAWAIRQGLIVPNAALGDAIVARASFMYAPSVGPSRALPWWREVPTLTLDDAGREAARRRIAGEPEPSEDNDLLDGDSGADDCGMIAA